MKKKLIFAAGAMIIAAVVSAAVCLNFGQTRHNDLFEQNLDALARGEGGGSSVMCSQTKNSGNYYMKDCSTCDKFNYYAMDKVGYCN